MLDQAQDGGFRQRRPMIVGVALVVAGGMVAAVGALVSTLAAVAGARHWVDQLDHPPSELAKVRWQQARAAGLAGAEAWKKASVI
jgi:hypothetical protein